MSLQHVKDTPTKRLFTTKFEFWIPRKYMLTAYDDQVAGIYQSGVQEIDDMHLNEEVPARLTIPVVAELASKGVKIRVGNPDVKAMEIFQMLLAHAEHVKKALADEGNVRAPNLESTRILESFMGMMWEVARRRIKNPEEFSGFTTRLSQVMVRRSRLGSARREQGPTAKQQLDKLRRSEFSGTQMEELIVRRNAARGISNK